ncbi:MAG: YtxH domain-containing protein [Candidatus Gastranaerophilales bacterium]|nr:YtxH domain-containing protein [Candidatus Gastranaerophilales bacterium]
MSKSSDSSVSFGVGLLFGVLTGVATGILFSPKSGEEMRQDLKEIVNDISGEIKPNIYDTKNASTDLINRIKYTVENQICKINNALKAGRLAAAKHKEELESGINF